MQSLRELYLSLADALDGNLQIEKAGRQALQQTADEAFAGDSAQLPQPIVDVMQATDAHPCCELLAASPLPWAPPISTTDPDYLEVSKRKVLAELVGPDGIVKSNQIRLGVYGILPDVHYGIRTHPAEEVFVMLAGRADWLRDDEEFREYGVGTRRHHPSMMRHATRTRDSAFMSIYIWQGDVSYDNYVYSGT